MRRENFVEQKLQNRILKSFNLHENFRLVESTHLDTSTNTAARIARPVFVRLVLHGWEGVGQLEHSRGTPIRILLYSMPSLWRVAFPFFYPLMSIVCTIQAACHKKHMLSIFPVQVKARRAPLLCPCASQPHVRLPSKIGDHPPVFCVLPDADLLYEMPARHHCVPRRSHPHPSIFFCFCSAIVGTPLWIFLADVTHTAPFTASSQLRSSGIPS